MDSECLLAQIGAGARQILRGKPLRITPRYRESLEGLEYLSGVEVATSTGATV